MLANLSVDKGSQEAIVADADLVLHALLDVLAGAILDVPPAGAAQTATRPNHSGGTQGGPAARPGPLSSRAAAGAPRAAGAHSRVASDSRLPLPAAEGGVYTSSSGGQGVSTSAGSSVVASAVSISVDSISGWQQQQLVQGGGLAAAHPSLPATGPGAAAGPYPSACAASLGSGPESTGPGSTIPCIQDPAVASQLHCFVAVALSNTMGHTVIARAALTHARTVPLLCALIMRVPAPRCGTTVRLWGYFKSRG